jgi:hypothetical protein
VGGLNRLMKLFIVLKKSSTLTRYKFRSSLGCLVTLRSFHQKDPWHTKIEIRVGLKLKYIFVFRSQIWNRSELRFGQTGGGVILLGLL